MEIWNEIENEICKYFSVYIYSICTLEGIVRERIDNILRGRTRLKKIEKM